MKIIGVIPARYESTRFRGKPLADICGKPMIWWVYSKVKHVEEISDVYVATDDQRIYDTCIEMEMNVIMTSSDHKTGTDRVGEVARQIEADLYINIQGDEPMIEAETISKAIEPFYKDPDLQVSNLMTRITNPVDVVNSTVPKVIANRDGRGIFLTRSSSPYPKGSIEYCYYKQVCVYGFTPSALEFFCNNPRGQVESIEDIEILRFIESGFYVKYVEVESDTIAVDTVNDLKKVRTLMSEDAINQ